MNPISLKIGNTPLVQLPGKGAPVFAKLELCNPTGSAKDRAALYMLRDALRTGRLAPGGRIIEPTSGNTGISLAMLASAEGCKATIVMPDTMSRERQELMKAYGAQVILTPGDRGMAGSIQRAKELAASTPGSYIPDQFSNPANAQAHYETTGPEIWEQTQGRVDILVAGVGTGGTLTGTGRYLKEKKPGIQVVAVEPAASPVLSGGQAGPHGLQGIGAGFVPAVLDRGILDEVIAVRQEDAVAMARELKRKEGILAGFSSGAALWAARELALREENRGKTIVVILPDSGSRYLSAGLFEP